VITPARGLPSSHRCPSAAFRRRPQTAERRPGSASTRAPTFAPAASNS
jgi:hypothetical protein